MHPWLPTMLLATHVAIGCECSALDECGLAAQPVIFIGKAVSGGVESIRDHPWYTPTKPVRFQVLQILRGLPLGTQFVEVETWMDPGMCAPNPYSPGRTYLVTPANQKGKFWDGLCFSGLDVEFAREAVDYLRRQYQNPPKRYVRGRVGAVDHRSTDVARAILYNRDAKPLQGARVTATLGSKTLSATTDASGRYEIEVPEPGLYHVNAKSAPYSTADETIVVPDNAPCAVKNFAMLSKSSISGVVTDKNGKPLKSAAVGLFDIDTPSSASWFRREFSKDSDGTFRFDNVPIGRYLLAFNPDGAHNEGHHPHALEASYHLAGAGRSQARVIVVDRAGQRLERRDLKPGPPVAFRSVTVKVRFPDGAPMSTASISVSGEPLAPGGIEWNTWKHLDRGKSEATFQAPTNRKLRIVIRDAYGRDLKKPYESTHSPGTTPVFQDFIIAP